MVNPPSIYPTPKKPEIKSSKDISNEIAQMRSRNKNKLPFLVSLYLSLALIGCILGHFLGVYILQSNIISGVFMTIFIGAFLFFICMRVLLKINDMFYYLLNISGRSFIVAYLVFIAPVCIAYSVFASSFSVMTSALLVLAQAAITYLLAVVMLRLEIKYEKSSSGFLR